MKRILSLSLCIAILAAVLPASATFSLSISNVMVSAGDEVSVYYNLVEDGTVTLSLINEAGQAVALLLSEHQGEGFHEFIWDGTAQGIGLPSGSYDLELAQGDSSIRLKLMLNTPDSLLAAAVELPATPPDITAETEHEAETAAAASEAYTPTPAVRSAHRPDHDPKGCYWCTPMDITDEETVWAMLTSPIYTLDENQKSQVIVRAEPDEKSAGIGVVTGTSVGVHVLENRKDGWSLIECYSDSFHDSRIKAWNAFITGYVRTSLIQKKTPNQEYGIVVDKLTQTLYLFHDGHLMSTLAVSTGLYNERQPYNETRSGEFLLVSKVGDFKSDAMICADALRFNGGDLIHEVPYVKNADGSKNYKATEYKLGNRGSHGCIRVQRLRNPDGINMQWLYDNLAVNAKSGTRIVIWEDFQGRQLPIPDDDLILYYNPAGGQSYHAVEDCNGVRDEYLPLTPFRYGDLETPAFQKLTVCYYCQPVKRRSEIEAINQDHLTRSPGMVADYHQK